MVTEPTPTGTKTVLFVDDEPAISDGLRRILRPFSDRWRVITCNRAEEALAILGTTPVDVVVSDLRMPEMDGVTLLKLVRERHPLVARIVLSGSASSPAEAMAAAEVAHVRLDKPCSRDQLVAALQSAGT